MQNQDFTWLSKGAGTTMADEVDPGDIDDVGTTPSDFLDHEPSKHEKMEMRRAIKPPSEWLKLLCRDWALENDELVTMTDSKFMDYKPYLKGLLTSQLLIRLSVPAPKEASIDGTPTQPSVDFWRILGIEDEFDKSYIIAQIERFCCVFNLRGAPIEEDSLFAGDYSTTDPTPLGVSPPAPLVPIPAYMEQNAAVAAAAAAAAASVVTVSKKQATAHRQVKDAEKQLEFERRQNIRREQKRLTQEKREQKAREREAVAYRKSQERAAREASREERRKRKVEIREHREKVAKEQKEAAMQRAAELVSSNRVPIEITRGAAAAKAAANAALVAGGAQLPIEDIDDARKKQRSAIVVSTAADLHTICTHAKNLWAKYNAIAKEHNQKVNWITVAKELGIHVKVREKYARMHARAEARGFDWVKNGDWKIKDHPEIFLEPTPQEQRSKMPRDLALDAVGAATVLIDSAKDVTDEAVAAAAAVVDASVTAHHVDTVVGPVTEEQTAAAAALAATMVADPTSHLVDESTVHV